MKKIGIIGGSGLYKWEAIENPRKLALETPFGSPSDHYLLGNVGEVEIVFLPRHGEGHRITPGEINYRANIYGMKKLGVDAIISVSACGSLKEEVKPMDFLIPDQFVNRSLRLEPNSFFGNGIVAHVNLADPTSRPMNEVLYKAAQQVGVQAHSSGTYLQIEGPQFSTRAESKLYQSWGMAIVGMTNFTEAKLAREAELGYATLAAVTDYDCWHAHYDSVSVELVLENLRQNVDHSKQILLTALPEMGKIESFGAENALADALVTDPSLLTDEVFDRLGLLIGKYFPSQVGV